MSLKFYDQWTRNTTTTNTWTSNTNITNVIDTPEIVEECTEKWFNQSLTKINESVARIGIVEGEYHWHRRIIKITTNGPLP